MSAKDAVWARDQSKRRPVRVPIEQSIHKRKPAKTVEAVKPVEFEPEPEPTVDEIETLDTGEDIF